MDINGSIHCVTDYNGRVSHIRLTGKKCSYAVDRRKNSVGFYDRKLFEQMAYAIKNRFIDDTK